CSAGFVLRGFSFLGATYSGCFGVMYMFACGWIMSNTSAASVTGFQFVRRIPFFRTMNLYPPFRHLTWYSSLLYLWVLNPSQLHVPAGLYPCSINSSFIIIGR